MIRFEDHGADGIEVWLDRGRWVLLGRAPTRLEAIVQAEATLRDELEALVLIRAAAPAFGYCATCHHPLDRCSHCAPPYAAPRARGRHADDTKRRTQ